MTDTRADSLLEILQKHLKHRRCDDEWYLSREGLSVLKGELLAYELARAESSKPVSLEKCAAALKRTDGRETQGDDFISYEWAETLAKAVLDAAGVKYVD